jgi:hypothetical protein
MTPLRQLSVIYLIVAGAFTASILFARHPQLAEAARQTIRMAQDETVTAISTTDRYAVRPGLALAGKEAGTLHQMIADAIKPAPVQVAAAKTKPNRVAATAEPSVRLPLHPPTIAPPAAPHVLPPEASLPPAPPKSAGAPPTTAGIVRVEQRLKDSLTTDMFDRFDLFLYVSKADKGPWAQHMFVFQKTGTELAMLYDWPVSTGREKIEYNQAGDKLPSFTPRGYYELDPHRFYVHYTSMQWRQAMPYAMFFKWEKDGMPTGLAIHGATGGDIGLLGTRSSAGCIRLAPENAALLQSLIRAKYKGLVPEFSFDRKTDTISNDGVLAHDAGGKLRLVKGYRVLVFIEDYGGENVVAALF